MGIETEHEPVEVRAPKGASVLEIDWADGHRGVYPHEFLRGFCPCVLCQGHEGPIGYIEGGNQDLEDLQSVGSYALRFRWSDGHETGIYSFVFLRRLCMCAECAPPEPRQHTFRR